MYGITARRLLDTMAYAKTNPEATLRTGLWFDPYWTGEQVRQWFRNRLDAKINRNRKPAGKRDSDSYLAAYAHDARVINDYYGRRIRNHGRNLLHTCALKRRYPHIDNPPRDE
jgi:hypothetical protein